MQSSMTKQEAISPFEVIQPFVRLVEKVKHTALSGDYYGLTFTDGVDLFYCQGDEACGDMEIMSAYPVEELKRIWFTRIVFDTLQKQIVRSICACDRDIGDIQDKIFQAGCDGVENYNQDYHNREIAKLKLMNLVYREVQELLQEQSTSLERFRGRIEKYTEN